jgi:hypothetical protein
VVAASGGPALTLDDDLGSDLMVPGTGPPPPSEGPQPPGAEAAP